LVALIEPALKVIVDAGYNRNISPGTPTRAQLFPRINLATFANDLVNAVEQGITDVQNLPPSVAATSSTAIKTAAPAAKISAAAGRKARANSTIHPASAASAVRPHSHPARPKPSRARASASPGA